MSICDSCGQAVEGLGWDPCAVREGAGSMERLIFGAVQRCGPYEIAPTPWPTNDDGSDAWTISYGLSEIGRYPSISACRLAAESHLHTSEHHSAPSHIYEISWWKRRLA